MTGRTSLRFATVLAAALAAGTLIPGGTAAAHDDFCGTAHEVGTQTSGIVSTANKNDWWRSSGAVPARTFTLTPSGGDADLYVYAADCSTVLCTSNSGGTRVDTCTVPTLQPVQVLVTYYYSESGSVPYTLTATPAVRTSPPLVVQELDYPSDDCAYGALGGDLVTGFAGDVFVTLRTQRAGSETWVCTRVDSSAGSYGGKLVVPDATMPDPARPSFDSASDACTNASGNQVPVPQPVVNVLGGTVVLGMFADNDEAWICLRAPGVNTRVIVPVGVEGAIPAVTFHQDAPGRHAVAASAPDVASGSCQRAGSGTTRYLDLASNGVRAYLYSNLTDAVASLCVGTRDPGVFGGVLKVDVAGGWTPRLEFSADDVSPCTQEVVKAAGYTVKVGRAPDSASVCLLLPDGGALRVTAAGTGGDPVGITWTPDSDAILE